MCLLKLISTEPESHEERDDSGGGGGEELGRNPVIASSAGQMDGDVAECNDKGKDRPSNADEADDDWAGEIKST